MGDPLLNQEQFSCALRTGKKQNGIGFQEQIEAHSHN